MHTKGTSKHSANLQVSPSFHFKVRPYESFWNIQTWIALMYEWCALRGMQLLVNWGSGWNYEK